MRHASLNVPIGKLKGEGYQKVERQGNCFVAITTMSEMRWIRTDSQRKHDKS